MIDMNIFQVLVICGMPSPVVYTLMWIFGGFLRSDYSHIRNNINSLFAVGTPRKWFYDAFKVFVVTNAWDVAHIFLSRSV